MHQIIKNLFIGNQTDIPGDEFAVINAAKNPWHVDIVGYKGKLEQDHPNYLIHELDDVLTLNLIDPPFELSPEFTDPIFKKSLAFIKQNINNRPVLVRCNQGLSRSPSVVLVYLVRSGKIDYSSFDSARNGFIEYYPAYQPGKGVEAYLRNGWNRLITL